MRVVWTRHAEARLRAWGRSFGITRDEVERVLRNPEQVVPGDAGCQVAQARRGRGLLRVVFREEGEERRVLTLYWTSRVEKYWKRG